METWTKKELSLFLTSRAASLVLSTSQGKGLSSWQPSWSPLTLG